MAADTAILLIAHGSKLEEANKDALRVADEIRTRGLFACVEVSFLEFTRPTIAEGIDACARQGARQLLLLPYFLSLGAHVRRDLPLAVRQGEERHPGVTIALAEPLGFDPRLVDLALDRIAVGLRARGWAPASKP
jgi:sirohydrochlorin ferrochelatase